MSKFRVKLVLVTVTVLAVMGIFKNLFSQTENPSLGEIVKNGAFLVDVRTPSEFSAGHVKGSVNIPLDQVPNQLTQFKGKKNIVVFCQSGGRSSQAKIILEKNGFKNVTNGGSWQTVNELVNKEKNKK